MAFVYWSMSLSPLSKYCLRAARSLDPMLDSMFVSIFDTRTWSSPASCDPSPPALPPAAAPSIMDVMSRPVLWICNGYSDSVSSSTDLM